VISKPWFRIRSEFHAAVDAVAELALGGAGEPPKEPPGSTYALTGMPSDDKRWNLSHVRVDASQVLLAVPKGDDASLARPGLKAVIPVTILNDRGDEVGKKWVVVSRTHGMALGADIKTAAGIDIEKILMTMIDGERKAPPPPRGPPAGGQHPRMRISIAYDATLFDSKDEAVNNAVNAQ